MIFIFKQFPIEKCSESSGIKLVLFLFNSFLIKFHPQIIDSLLASAIFFEYRIDFNVGSKPSIPDIAFYCTKNFFCFVLTPHQNQKNINFIFINLFFNFKYLFLFPTTTFLL